MPTTLRTAIANYLRTGQFADGTRAEYRTTLKKWAEWSAGVPIEKLGRKGIRDFLDWVYEKALVEEGTSPGRTANKARKQLPAIISWAWEQEIIETPPRFPKPRDQRDVVGRHYLTKVEINALYLATHRIRRPRGWRFPVPVGRYWRSALVLYFNSDYLDPTPFYAASETQYFTTRYPMTRNFIQINEGQIIRVTSDQGWTAVRQ
jgi:hypothetical protein